VASWKITIALQAIMLSSQSIAINRNQVDALIREVRAHDGAVRCGHILREARETIATLQNENENHPDVADRASSETDRAIELRARDRQRKLIAKIDAALARIEEGTYGYCEETGEPIALKRLDARPIATLSVEAQERHERREKVYRDD
jgi:DnaK suppressor protein